MATTKKTISAKKDVPPFLCNLTYDTASRMVSVLSQQMVHSQVEEKEGHPELLAEFKELMPFFNALCFYVDKHR